MIFLFTHLVRGVDEAFSTTTTQQTCMKSMKSRFWFDFEMDNGIIFKKNKRSECWFSIKKYLIRI